MRDRSPPLAAAAAAAAAAPGPSAETVRAAGRTRRWVLERSAAMGVAAFGAGSSAAAAASVHPIWGDLAQAPRPPDFSANGVDTVEVSIDLAAGTATVTNGAPSVGINESRRYLTDNADARRVFLTYSPGGRNLRVRCSGKLTTSDDDNGWAFYGFRNVHVIGYDYEHIGDVGAGPSTALLVHRSGWTDPAHLADFHSPNHELADIYLEGCHINMNHLCTGSDAVQIYAKADRIAAFACRWDGIGSDNADDNANANHPDGFHIAHPEHGLHKQIHLHNVVVRSRYQFGILYPYLNANLPESRSDERPRYVFRRVTFHQNDPQYGGQHARTAGRAFWMTAGGDGGTIGSVVWDQAYVHPERLVAGATQYRYLVWPTYLLDQSELTATPSSGDVFPIEHPDATGAPIFGAPPEDFAPAAHVGENYVSPWR